MKRAASVADFTIYDLCTFDSVKYKIQSFIPTVSLISLTLTCYYAYQNQAFILSAKTESISIRVLDRMRQYFKDIQLLDLVERFIADSNSFIMDQSIKDFLIDTKLKDIPCIVVPSNTYDPTKVMVFLKENLNLEMMNPVLEQNILSMQSIVIYKNNDHNHLLWPLQTSKIVVRFFFTKADSVIQYAQKRALYLHHIIAWTDLKAIYCDNLIILLLRRMHMHTMMAWWTKMRKRLWMLPTKSSCITVTVVSPNTVLTALQFG